MKTLSSLLALAAASLSVVHAAQVRIQSPTAASGYTGFTADGDPLNTTPAGSVRFVAGVFDPGFNLTLPLAEWANHFTAATLNDAAWGLAGPTAGRFNGVSPVRNASFDLQQGYIFGSRFVAGDLAEIIVFSNPGWIFGLWSPTDSAIDAMLWSVGAPGTTIYGDAGELLDIATNGNDGFRFASTAPLPAAVPEPSTWAAGLLVLSVCFLRHARSRRRAA